MIAIIMKIFMIPKSKIIKMIVEITEFFTLPGNQQNFSFQL
jgi:hypothetical protein